MATSLRKKLMLCAPLLALGAAGVAAAQTVQAEALREAHKRMIAVAARLAIANVALCERRQFQPGLMVHDLSQYEREQRPATAAAYGLADGPGVLALAPAGGAERAGLLPNDNIIAADGAALPQAHDESGASYEPTARIVDALEAAFADGVAMLQISRRGRPLSIRVAADLGCASRFAVADSERATASADGRYVVLSTGMIAFARDDDELAASVAHELAHNILRHRARLNAAGVDRGLLARFGRSGRLFRQTELEADRLAVHLLARAGYDPEATIRLAVRQSRADTRLFAGTHPAWPARIAAMQAEVAAIRNARARGEIADAPLPRGPLTEARD